MRMLEYFLQVFSILFVIIDPPGAIPLFLGLTQGKNFQQKKVIIIKACLVAGSVLMIFTAFGGPLISHLKISEGAFQIAGAILLFIIGLNMVMTQDITMNMLPDNSNGQDNDVAVFPLAIPILAGPGGLIAATMLQRKAEGMFWMQLSIFASIILTMILTYFTLLLASPINRLLGDTGIKVLMKVFGIILTALAVQFIINALNNLMIVPFMKDYLTCYWPFASRIITSISC